MSRAAGIHAVEAVLREHPERARCLYVQQGLRNERIGRLVALARESGVRVQKSDRQWLDARTRVAHQGIMLDVHDLTLTSEREFEQRFEQVTGPVLMLLLENVTDPRNLGACLRSAAAAGVHAVLVPRRGGAPVNELALKTAAGAAEHLLIVEVANVARRLKWLADRGVWIVGAALTAPAAWHEADLTGPTAIVVGGEADGLKPLTLKHCDQLVQIPMAGAVQSLNVSVATGILLFEAKRQRD